LQLDDNTGAFFGERRYPLVLQNRAQAHENRRVDFRCWVKEQGKSAQTAENKGEVRLQGDSMKGGQKNRSRGVFCRVGRGSLIAAVTMQSSMKGTIRRGVY
jgi:hypothetical protein